MNIISVIQFQLSKILDLLEKDLNDGLVTYNYYVCEDECKLLNLYSLQEYLTEKDIKNLLFLKEINKKCNDIIKIWNEDFEDLPDRKLDEPFVYSNEEKGMYFSSIGDFYAIYLTQDKWHFYNGLSGKEKFIANKNYTKYTVPHIAHRCAAILNMITACYPETNDYNSVYKSEPDNDVRYGVVNFVNETAYSSKIYLDCKRQIELEKYDTILYNDEKIKVYSPEISYIFYNNKIEVKDWKNNREIFINTDPLFKAYYTGYKKGLEYFKNHYNPTPEIIYGQNAENYAKDVSYNYIMGDIPELPQYKGWNFVKSYQNLIISKKLFSIIGYYSGLCDATEKVVKQYPNLFDKGTETKEQQAPPPEQGEKKLTLQRIALYHAYESKTITKENCTEVAKKFGHNSGQKLYQHFTYYYSTANRKGEPKNCTAKILKNKISLIESVIPLLSDSIKDKAKDEVTILKDILETKYL